MKLFKFISSSGIISRRKAQESIQLAMVTVNNVLVMDPFAEIDPLKDTIRPVSYTHLTLPTNVAV